MAWTKILSWLTIHLLDLLLPGSPDTHWNRNYLDAGFSRHLCCRGQWHCRECKRKEPKIWGGMQEPQPTRFLIKKPTRTSLAPFPPTLPSAVLSTHSPFHQLFLVLEGLKSFHPLSLFLASTVLLKSKLTVLNRSSKLDPYIWKVEWLEFRDASL